MGLRVEETGSVGGGSSTPWRVPFKTASGTYAFAAGTDCHIAFTGAGELDAPASPADDECIIVSNLHSAAITVDFQAKQLAQTSATTYSLAPGETLEVHFDTTLDKWVAA